jgi:hypothetical protein
MMPFIVLSADYCKRVRVIAHAAAKTSGDEISFREPPIS